MSNFLKKTQYKLTLLEIINENCKIIRQYKQINLNLLAYYLFICSSKIKINKPNKKFRQIMNTLLGRDAGENDNEECLYSKFLIKI